MDIAKKVFEAIDVALNRSQNDLFHPEGEERVIVDRDIVYREEEKEICRLDCYRLPEREELYPVLFYIHGGGFMAGGKEYRRTLCTWYATLGYFVVNVDYGLCPDYTFPEPLRHLASALDWVVENAERYGLDGKRMVVGGDSAGAYYGAMLAVIGSHPKLQKKYEIKPKGKFAAAVLNCGLYDVEAALGRRMLLDLNEKVFEAYTGVKFAEADGFAYRDCFSPLAYIDRHFPPSMIVYAKKDIFCGGQAERLCEKLQAANVYFESYASASLIANHCFSLSWKGKEAEQANEKIRSFLERFRDGTMPKKAEKRGKKSGSKQKGEDTL